MPSFDSLLSRRQLLRVGAVSTAVSMSGWMDKLALAAGAAKDPQRKRSCILLWMSGGPSQMDTFDLKPGHANGGPFAAAETSVSDIRISEHFPQVGKLAKHLAIIRSMNSKEGDHGRATYLLRTGYVPQGPIQYPSLGALVSKELGADDAELPAFVSVAPFRVLNQGAFGSGFLGPRYAPLIVGEGGIAVQQQGPTVERALRVKDLSQAADVSRAQAEGRLGLLKQVTRALAAGHPDAQAGINRIELG